MGVEVRPAPPVAEPRRRWTRDRVLALVGALVVGTRRPLPPQYRVVAAGGDDVPAVRDGGCAPAPADVRAAVLERPPLTSPLTSRRGPDAHETRQAREM